MQVAGALAAHLLHAVEQGLLDDWLMESFDHLAAVAPSGDVASVGGVAEHLSDGSMLPYRSNRRPPGGRRALAPPHCPVAVLP